MGEFERVGYNIHETWIQKKGWERVKIWLPKGYIWEYKKQKDEVKTGGRWRDDGKEGGD